MDDLHVKPGILIPGWELWFTASRSGGPGGQHVNTTNSRVSLHWNVDNSVALTPYRRAKIRGALHNRISDGVLVVHVSDSRSQHRNREIALERLAALICEALKVQKVRRTTRPSRSAKKRRLDKKKQRGSLKKSRGKPNID